MAVNRLISVDEVIRHTIQNFGIDTDINEDYFIDYIANALQDIGTFNQLVMKQAIVTIENYRGEMPCDYYKLHQIGSFIPTNSVSNINYNTILPEKLNYITDRINKLKYLIDNSTVNEEIVAYSKELTDLNVFLLESQPNSTKGVTNLPYRDKTILFSNQSLVGDVESNKFSKSDFKLEHNLITVGYETGFVKIIYMALPVDDNGYPLIPENISFRNAIGWYIAHKLAIRGKLSNKELSVQYCDRMWQRYCLQAKGDAYMPDITQMQEMANEHNKILNNPNLYYQRFRDLGKRQTRTNY